MGSKIVICKRDYELMVNTGFQKREKAFNGGIDIIIWGIISRYKILSIISHRSTCRGKNEQWKLHRDARRCRYLWTHQKRKEGEFSIGCSMQYIPQINGIVGRSRRSTCLIDLIKLWHANQWFIVYRWGLVKNHLWENNKNLKKQDEVWNIAKNNFFRPNYKEAFYNM